MRLPWLRSGSDHAPRRELLAKSLSSEQSRPTSWPTSSTSPPLTTSPNTTGCLPGAVPTSPPPSKPSSTARSSSTRLAMTPCLALSSIAPHSTQRAEASCSTPAPSSRQKATSSLRWSIVRSMVRSLSTSAAPLEVRSTSTTRCLCRWITHAALSSPPTTPRHTPSTSLSARSLATPATRGVRWSIRPSCASTSPGPDPSPRSSARPSRTTFTSSSPRSQSSTSNSAAWPTRGASRRCALCLARRTLTPSAWCLSVLP
mmetsp:Transcript_31489/g.68024  ORF Transcript_31489/g.68024 Transcript_31489/m.68024 type:complete len:258 (-) Transcript_31489:802-1575(-)